MTSPLYNEKLIADFIKAMVDQGYSLESGKLENNSGATVTYKGLAYPLKAGTSGAGYYEVMTAAESAVPANIVGFLVTNRHEEIATGGESKAPYAVLVRGEATVAAEGFATADPYAAAAYDVADFQTFCDAANPPIIVRTFAGLQQGPIGAPT